VVARAMEHQPYLFVLFDIFRGTSQSNVGAVVELRAAMGAACGGISFAVVW